MTSFARAPRLFGLFGLLGFGQEVAPGAERSELAPSAWTVTEFAPSGDARHDLPGLAQAAAGPDAAPLAWWVERGEERKSGRLELARPRSDAEAATPFRAASRTIAGGDDWFLNWADRPGLAASDGVLVAYWLRMLGAGTYAYGAAFTRSLDGGETFEPVRFLHEDTSEAEHGFVSFAPGPDGSFRALWLDARHGRAGAPKTALFSRTLARDGTLSAEEELDELVCDCCPTALAGNTQGVWLAVYRDRSSDEVRDISFRRFDGARWSKPSTVFDDGWQIAGCPVNGPRVVALDDGSFVVAWYSGARGGDVRVARLAPQATAFGPPLDLDEGTPEGRVALAADGAGRLLVAWLEHTDEGVFWLGRVLVPEGAGGLRANTERAALRIAPTSSDRASGHLALSGARTGWLAAWKGAQGIHSASIRPAAPARTGDTK